MKKILIASFCLIAFGACSDITYYANSLQNKPEVKLVSKNSINGKIFKAISEEYKNVTIGFDGDRIFGFSGLNRYFGVYKLIDNKLVIDRLASTKMSGQDNDMLKELKFLTFLKDSVKVDIDSNGDVLSLTSSNGITIDFKNQNIKN